MEMTTIVWMLVFLAIVSSGIKIIRPTQRGLVETFGKYSGFREAGFNWIVPVIQRMIYVDITENMTNVEAQEIITKDKLNALVAAQVYYKVKADENSCKDSQYNVQDYENQIVSLSRTTLRNIIGTMSLNDANSGRSRINKELMDTLSVETRNWGIEVVRTELKEITPPPAVQTAMNEVVMAENKKQSAVDFATAKETEADGLKRAAIKQAEGLAKAVEIEADAKANAIRVVNEAAEKYFIGNAQILKKLEVTQASLQGNSKIVLTEKGISPMIVIGEMGAFPVKEAK